jgi:chromosome segregation ATPase
MAIICCATPSEMYLEETRSTLQFASRAKLVKTRATVNEVLDERSMIKKLQRELAVAKRAADGEIDMSQIRELESEAARAENVAKTVQEKYEKLKASILKGGMFQDSVIVKNRKRISSIRTPAKDTILNITSPSLHGMDRKRRRQSDGIVHHYNPVSSPLLDVTNRNVALATLTPTLERKAKSNAEETAYLQDSGSFQIVLLKEALSAKGDITRDMNRRLNEWEEEAERYGASLNSAQSEINTLKEDHSSSIAQVELLSAEKEALELQRQDIVDELNDKSVEKDTAINKALATIESMLMEKEQLEGNIESLEDQNEKQDATMSQMKTDFDAVKEQCDVLQDKCAVNDAIIEKNDSDITEHIRSNAKLLVNLVEAKEFNVASVQTNEALQGQIRDLTFTVNNLNSDIINGGAVAHTIQEQKELAESLANQMSDKEDSALSENQCLIKQNSELDDQLQSLVLITAELKNELVMKNSDMEVLMEEKDLAETLSSQMSRAEDSALTQFRELQGRLQEMEVELAQKESKLGELSESKTIVDENLEQAKTDNKSICHQKSELDDQLQSLVLITAELKNELVMKNSEIEVLMEEKDLAETLSSQMSRAEDSALTQFRELQGRLQEMEVELAQKESKLVELSESKTIVDENLEQAKTENKSICHQKSELDDQLQSLVLITAELKNKLVMKNSEIEVLMEEKDLAETLSSQMSRAEDSALTQFRELQGRLQEMEVELAQKVSKLVELSESKTIVDENLEQAKADNKSICHQKSELDDQLQSLVLITAELKNELVMKNSDMEVLIEEKDLAETLSSQMSRAEDSALTQFRELQGRLQEMEVELAQKESKLVELSESKTIVDDNLEQSRSERGTIFASNNSLKEKEILLSDTVANLKNDLARSSEVVDTLLKEKELSEALASQMSEAEDAALLQAQELVEHVHKLHSEVVEKSQMNMELLNAKETLAKDVHQLSILLDESKVENKELTETKDLLTEKLEQLAIETSSLNDALSNGDTAAENLVSEKKRIQDLLNDMTEAKHVASTEMEDIRKMLVQAESTTEEAHSELEELNICKLSIQQTLFEAKNQIEGLIHRNDELNKEVTNLRSTRSRLEEDAAAKEFVFETLTREKDLAEAVASQISQMEDCGIQNIHELSKELNVNIHNCMELRAENEKLMTSRDQDQVLAKKLHLAEERINSTEISLNEQYKLVETLQEDNRALSINLENQELKLDASLTVKNANNANIEIHADMMKAQEAEIENYAEEILNLEDALKKCESTLSNMSVKYDIEAQKLTDANRELQLTQSELYQSRNSTEPSTKKDDQSEQIQELQQLLASANAREEEIKKFALATDEELEHKEEEYEEAVLYATECESAAKEWEQKYRSLDAHEPAASGQNTEQILNEMELLLDEKVELEKRLETALSDCDILENDLKKKYEHEQTELLQEADAKMKCIREEVTLRENELEKHKRDARITREELVAIQDQLKSDQSAAIDADEKVLQLTEQFSSAEETSTQLAIELENVKDEYNSFKEHVRSSKESSKLGAERKLTSAKEELALLRETLHGETLKARSCEKDVEVYEKDIIRLQAEMSSTKQSLINEKDYAVSKLKEEIALAKVELSRAQADIFSLNQDVDHYKAAVKKAKNENKSNEDTIKYHELLKMNEESRQDKNAEIQEYTKALVSCQDDAEELKKSVKELKSKIKSKDERITNLEAKRLTKEHVAMIKKLKVRVCICVSESSFNLS